MAKLDSPIQPGYMAPYSKLPVPQLTPELLGLVRSDAVYSLAVIHYCGKIINIASLLAVQGGITIPAYTASKHAIVGLTKALCNEWASRGINVNAIAPGYMNTDLNVALRANPQRDREISERVPAGRWGMPEDMAGAIVFLASSASDYLHGHMLVIDGGWLAR